MLGRVIIACISAVPVVYFVIVMGWGASISKQVAELQSGESTDFSFSTPLTWIADAKEYRRLFSTEELNDERVVDIQIDTTMADLMGAGEKLPDPGLFTLYATARAPGALIKQCDLVLEDLGLACDVLDFESEVEPSGQVLIKGSLAYVPAYDLGSPEGISNGKFVRVYHRLVDRKEELENTRENTLKLMADARRQCEELRVTYGNCIIGTLAISRKFYREVELLDAMAVFKIYVDRTQHDGKTITASLTEENQ